MNNSRVRACRPWLPPVVLIVLGALAWAPIPAQVDEEQPSETARPGRQDGEPVRHLLDAVREDLVNLRFEKALAGIEALLGGPGMSEEEQAEALVLRSQAHVAFGDLDAAEEDYREILRMRPGYEPDVSLTPDKAMVRFRKARDELIGHLRVDLHPSDAHIGIDGTEVTTGGGLLPLLAGEHEIRVHRKGHDPVQQTVRVDAGKESPLVVRLMPNARTIVLRTEQDGVAVILDGVAVGATARPEAGMGGSQAPAELVVEDLPTGEHLFELKKECYRDERLKDVLTIDLMDGSPKVYKPIRMVPASATLTFAGGPSGAEVFVDGSPIGHLPMDQATVCPGSRPVEVRYGGRVIWQTVRELREAVDERLEVVPRPNAVLVGADAWPAEVSGFTTLFSTVEGVPLPSGLDISEPAGWAGLQLPENTDLALGVVPATRQGAPDLWYLYSPILRTVHRMDAAPSGAWRPMWHGVTWGFGLADSMAGGSLLVVEVAEAGPAESAGLAVGDRILKAGGRKVSSAADLRALLAAAPPDRPVDIEWLAADGRTLQGRITGVPTPLLRVGQLGGGEAIARAAWALVDALCRPNEAPAALANLSLLFSAYGHHDLSADTWRRVHWNGRKGVGEGTKQYYLAIELERLGLEEEAIAAYRRAAASEATAFSDEGPRIAPAAEDRLADLGVAVSAQ